MNVLFITADQWRGECLSALGHPVLRTPHLDRLAAEGVVFARHYSQASPCSPGRASLYTGLYLHSHRAVVNGTPLDARHTNVALEARKAGYDPVLFGYTDVAADPRRRAPGDPLLRRQDAVLRGMTPVVLEDDEALPWRADLEAKGYRVPAGMLGAYTPRWDFPGAEGRGRTFAPALYRAEDSHSAFLTGEVIKYLSVRADRPWFVHLSYLAPHPPFVAPEPYHARYDPADVPAPVRAASPEAEASQHPFLAHYLYNQRGWGLYVGHESRRNLELDDREILQARATYYAMMNEVDDQVGRLIEFLRAAGLYDRTLIVFGSDHGEHLGDHWQFAKYSYFEQTFRVPLIVRDPRPVADPGRGRAVTHFTENVDVMPTLLDCLGLEVPVECEGEPLTPFLRGRIPGAWRLAAHAALDFRDFTDEHGEGPILGLTADECTFQILRGPRYKYVHFTALPPLLFDLKEDPNELNDLARDPAHRDIVLEQAQALLSWRMSHEERTLANTRLTDKGMLEHRGPRRSTSRR